MLVKCTVDVEIYIKLYVKLPCQYRYQSIPPFPSLTNLPVSFFHRQRGFTPLTFPRSLRRAVAVLISHSSFISVSRILFSSTRCLSAIERCFVVSGFQI